MATTENDAPDLVQIFACVRATADAIEAAENELSDAVGAAREAGASWEALALVLGVTTEAACERFAAEGARARHRSSSDLH